MKSRIFSTLSAVLAVAIISMRANAAEEILIFGSDIHSNTSTSTNVGVNNFKTDINTWILFTDYRWPFYGLVGDQVRQGANATTGKADFAAVTKAVTDLKVPATTKIFYSMGNHDLVSPLTASPGTAISGEAFNPAKGYADIFAISQKDWNINLDPNQWGTKKDGAAYKLNYWLLDKWKTNNGRLKIIMSHYPLHSKKLSGVDKTAADLIYQILDYYGSGTSNPDDTPLDIIFVWGDTHGYYVPDPTKPNVKIPWDKHVKMITPRLQKIATCTDIGASEGTLNNLAFNPLNFTSVNAGYVSNPDNPKIGPSTFVFTFDDDRDYYYVSRQYKRDGTGGEAATVERVDWYRTQWVRNP